MSERWTARVFGQGDELLLHTPNPPAWSAPASRRQLLAVHRALEHQTSLEWSDERGQHLAYCLELSGVRVDRVLVLSHPHESRAWICEGTLTPRQREVCEFAAAGATAKEVARHLGISPHTVRQHLKASYAELGVANRVELARAIGAAAR